MATSTQRDYTHCLQLSLDDRDEASRESSHRPGVLGLGTREDPLVDGLARVANGSGSHERLERREGALNGGRLLSGCVVGERSVGLSIVLADDKELRSICGAGVRVGSEGGSWSQGQGKSSILEAASTTLELTSLLLVSTATTFLRPLKPKAAKSLGTTRQRRSTVSKRESACLPLRWSGGATESPISIRVLTCFPSAP